MAKIAVWQQVGNFAPVRVRYCRSEKEAQQVIRLYEIQDRYEANVEGYGFPHGLPEYFYGKV